MHIQFRTLTLHSRLEEQLQERLRLKKSTTLLPVVIGALGSTSGPHPKSDLAIDLYYGSTPIAIIDESDRYISFKKSMTSLPVAIEALDYPLRPHPESDLVTYLYSVSTPIANICESDHRINFNRFKEFMISSQRRSGHCALL
jgi:hypothetical protein